MHSRLAHSQIQDRLVASPAVVLVGPRQAGKTTLARSMGGPYFDLEQEADRVRLDVEWPAVLEARAGGGPVVLDEAQAWPEVFPRLRGAIDAERDRNGRFLLLGSVSPPLMRRVSESLAGRLSIVELSPFLRAEVPHVPLDRHWLCGGYPDGGVLDASRFPRWQADYLALLTQRDLPAWGLPAAPQVTQRLVRMLAAVHGQVWNASQIGSALGISYATVNSYLDYFEGAFLIRRLQPYSGNLKKRLIKRPKVYWRDSGLLHAILQASTRDDLLAKPWVGQSWEGFAIDQILALLAARGEPHVPSYLRTSDGYEIDLVLETRGEIEAIEIKLTTQPSHDDLARLDRTADMIGAKRRVLVSRRQEIIGERDRMACSLEAYLEMLASD